MSVHFGPNPANESRNGLPSGAKGAVVQAKLISPTDADDPALEDLSSTWHRLDNATRSPYVHVLNPTVATVIAYRVAYTYSRARRGPRSDASQAAVTPAG
jgi:hypothetical protein